jgi:hypothetical protein
MWRDRRRRRTPGGDGSGMGEEGGQAFMLYLRVRFLGRFRVIGWCHCM